MSTEPNIREAVPQRYAQAATTTSCCGSAPADLSQDARGMIGPGGGIAFSDVIADDGMDEATKDDMVAWTGCIAGALTVAELTDALTAAGFTDIEIRPTHRVHTHAAAAIIRADR